MSAERTNEHGQPIGAALPDWQPPPAPQHAALEGRWSRLEPLAPERHAGPVFDAHAEAPDGRAWTYMGYGPFASARDYEEWMSAACSGSDALFFAIYDKDARRWAGVASFLRIQPALGSIEVGHVSYAPCLQRTRAGSEAMYLLMRHAFELGYRRYEWKCDALNAASRAAALRYGFRFEGVFRQSMVYKGRNRDTAWYALLDGEFEGVRERFEAWLAPENFDAHGRQRTPLTAAQDPRS